MKCRRGARPRSTRALTFMNLPKHIFGGIAARLPFICQTSIGRKNTEAFPRIVSTALVIALCALGLPQRAEATTLSAGDIAIVGFGSSLQFVAVPEPQTWITAFCGLGTLVAMQRFRRTRH